MFALIENGQFVKIVNSNKGITIGDNQYPKSIYNLWSEDERNAIGIYEVSVDNTNKKDEAYYINTDISYSYANGVVTASYGTATAKPLDDVLFTQADADADEIPSDKAVGDVKQYGLKGQKISIIKQQAGGLLAPTDWHVVKATEVSDYSVPTDIATYRANVRAKSNEMETQINACSDVDALKTLFTWTEDSEGNITRPLAEFPEEL
jgi:hypothetical protein